MSPTPSHPRSIWIERFTARLEQIHPGIARAKLAIFAADFFGEAAHLQPEEAADLFVRESNSQSDMQSETDTDEAT